MWILQEAGLYYTNAERFQKYLLVSYYCALKLHPGTHNPCQEYTLSAKSEVRPKMKSSPIWGQKDTSGVLSLGLGCTQSQI